jgi:hypothetical protein
LRPSRATRPSRIAARTSRARLVIGATLLTLVAGRAAPAASGALGPPAGGEASPTRYEGRGGSGGASFAGPAI